MSELVLNNSGATITITNISATIQLRVENGIISPTLINKNLNETGELPVYAIQVPSFVSYKYNTIQPGDSITFESTNDDEILYYYGISKNPFAGVAVTVTPNEGGGSAVLIEKTITENGTYNAVDDEADGYSSVTVDIPVPTTGTKSGAVIRDYDGSIVASYTPAQFAALSAYPAPPVHTGLTGQGYNWTLANAKDYVAKYGYVEVGTIYITDDGKTRFYVNRENYSEPESNDLEIEGSGTVIVDWGDGSEADEVELEGTSETFSHYYDDNGTFIITLTVINGNVSLVNSSFGTGYDVTLNKVEIGSGITSIDEIFCVCPYLTTITIPNGVSALNGGTFIQCSALTSLNIPNSITVINDFTFEDCSVLKSVVLPDSIVTIGKDAFGYSVQGVFTNCFALTSITIPESVTKIGAYLFKECHALTSITIPESVTKICGGAFVGCSALTSMTIPNSVTYLQDDIVYNCTALTSINIPSGITTINRLNLEACSALTSIIFSSTTPPVISSQSTYPSPYLCKIYVPTGSLQAYTTAESYPDPTTYTYVEYSD